MNLLFDCATVGFISLGIVCVLMLGEIDLSVGSMSGLASAIVGVLWVNAGWPLAGAIAVALACGVAVGLVYALLYTRVGMPSFVATRRPAGAAGYAAVYPRAERQHQPALYFAAGALWPTAGDARLVLTPDGIAAGLAILIFGLKNARGAWRPIFPPRESAR
ncbi:hypothetical protein M3O75_21220 [Klebsiella pneumoniae]|nr:hypothetical protein [Klebsiella pneumoniae]